MKQIVCEMCESTKFSKEDGFFVCSNCGMKYSPEEAKKLMIEVEDSNVEINENPKDTELENLYSAARLARNNNDSESARKYYEMILLKDPLSWEGVFFSTYYTAMATNIANIANAALSVNNCIGSAMSLVNSELDNEAEQLEAVKTIEAYTISIATMLYNAATNHYNGIDSQIKSNYTDEYNTRASATITMQETLGDEIVQYFADNDEMCGLAVSAWNSAKLRANEFTKKRLMDKMMKYAKNDESKKHVLYGKIEQIDKQITDKKNMINSYKPGIAFVLMALAFWYFLPSYISETMMMSIVLWVIMGIGIICLLVSLGSLGELENIKKLEQEKDDLRNQINDLG